MMNKFLLLLFICLFGKLSAQVTGTVTDENGEPLPYVTVYQRNTSNGTVTNSGGHYKLNVPDGEQELVFQFIGYKQRIEKVKVQRKPVVLNVRMEPSDLELQEVVVSSKDPAIRIMRAVIEKRRYYKKKVSNYSCDVYIKGLYKLLDAPSKVMGQEVGNMGGVLDTNRTGVIYLSESVSKVWTQDPPGRKKEVMVSSKVSGSENGFSLNRTTLTEFDLYGEKIEVEREILSPLADNAFSYYNFKYAGRFKNELGFTIEKIKVIPKRSADPTFSGFLYVVDELWLLAGADLALTGAAIKQPVLDTLRIQQQFVPLGEADSWGLLTQVTSFKFGIFGFKIGGFYNGVFSNYVLNPEFPDGLFSRETFKVEDKANEQSADYWAETRPVPLTEEEQKDYVKKDSLQRIWKSEAYLDSMDRKNNKFKTNNLLFGYTWRNSFKRTSVSYPAVFRWVQFNTVQGLLLDIKPEWEKDSDRQSLRTWKVIGDLNYGFAEQKLRANLRIQRKFDSKFYRTLSLEGGNGTAQFNPKNPIGPLMNTQYSLYSRRNYLKIYDKTWAYGEWTQVLVPSLSMRLGAGWAHRTPLVNHTDYSWNKKEDRVYTSNDPVPDVSSGDPEAFPSPDIFSIEAQLTFKPGRTYSSYPKYRSYEDSDWPDFILSYKKALPLANNGWADFDQLKVLIKQDELSWGLAGYTNWNVTAGLFLRKQNLSFMDLHHVIGNRTAFSDSEFYHRAFMLLPYYAWSTDKPFVELHAQHHLQGWLLDKIPGLRKLNWKELFGARFYYSEQASRDPQYTQKLPYWELNAGFENIGFKAIRPLRVDFVFGFFGEKFYHSGVIFGINL